MKQLPTQAVVLRRTDYGEADRILTLLTPDHGKLRLMARGVRRPKSKLAGGIELFSLSDITFIQGRSDIGTLTSSRLNRHYGTIIRDIERVQTGYALIKMLDRTTEDHPEPAYFDLLRQTFEALDQPDLDLELIRAWFECQLLRLAGHSPNLATDTAGHKLSPDHSYDFNFETMAFTPHAAGGHFSVGHIKALRLLLSHNLPRTLSQIQGLSALMSELRPLISSILTLHIRT